MVVSLEDQQGKHVRRRHGCDLCQADGHYERGSSPWLSHPPASALDHASAKQDEEATLRECHEVLSWLSVNGPNDAYAAHCVQCRRRHPDLEMHGQACADADLGGPTHRLLQRGQGQACGATATILPRQLVANTPWVLELPGALEDPAAKLERQAFNAYTLTLIKGVTPDVCRSTASRADSLRTRGM